MLPRPIDYFPALSNGVIHPAYWQVPVTSNTHKLPILSYLTGLLGQAVCGEN